MKISIAMATYNGEKYLQEQLDSFLNQTVLPDELIVVDDCSKDSTFEILQSFKKNAPFEVTIIRNEQNIGSTKSFEKACKIATGDWIFFSDQDDVWIENKIEEFKKVFNSNIENLGLVFCGYDIVDANLNEINCNRGIEFIPHMDLIESDNAYVRLLQGNVTPGCVMAVKREVIQESLPFCDKWHDYWLMLCASVNYRIRIIKKNLIQYRQHSGQQLGCNLNSQSFQEEKNFFQKYIYDYKKFERRKIVKIKNFIEKYNTASLFAEHVKFSYNKPIIIDAAIRCACFYKTRLELAKKSKLFRFIPLLKLYLKGYYKDWIPDDSFTEFRRDVMFPVINADEINL